MSAARRVLERLLRRAEAARRRGDDRPASLSMASARDAQEYLAMDGWDQREAFHAQIALAERDGAIAVQRDRLRGDGQRLLRLTVVDLAALARHLGLPLYAEQAAAAAALLAPWISRFPVIERALAAWRQGRKVRGCDAQAAADLADAARAVAAREDDAGHERILRRESVRLFGDSKRLERLTPWLEVLATGELAAGGLAQEAVWALLGLRREPQPLLLAGAGAVELDGGLHLPLPHPYLGVPVQSLRAVVTPARCLLSIENLASFHDAARTPQAASALLLYTGGMPSPAWRAAYARILRSLPESTPAYHWGDIDEGGLRIAAVLARSAQDAGRTLRPWRMSPDALPPACVRDARVPDASTLAAMVRWAERAGWEAVAQALRRRPLTLEQESLPAALPLDPPATGR
ncbi:Wadjet anti-phage system protein JetD domain-containing protein [Pseudoxanthomonas suwonensis]|uniref:Wadjet anti-phage system protein JetD domain-containing protein n=1 Tax=Pseudoxanthomonas suwonensis TaxID=314722 RepID=UPI0012DD7878|nr:Wadjet anti-phage system protein JetD domain-containing protein [Pseudoxanthomonas suwonensis]